MAESVVVGDVTLTPRELGSKAFWISFKVKTDDQLIVARYRSEDSHVSIQEGVDTCVRFAAVRSALRNGQTMLPGMAAVDGEGA